MGTLDPVFVEGILLSPRHLSKLRRLGEMKGRLHDIGDEGGDILDELVKLSKIESIESSNRLEGIIVEHSRIEKISLKRSDPRSRSEQEVTGYRDALDMIHLSHEELELSLDLIKELHRMIYSYTPEEGGSWKAKDNLIIERSEKGSKIRFRPTSAEKTPEAMERLLEEWEMSVSMEMDPMVTIPLLILDYLCIHPFSDGNGRTARLLTLLILYKEWFVVGKYISLERVIEDLKVGYYDALYISSQGWHEGEPDVLPWLDYFWTVLLKAYEELEIRVESMGRKGENKTMRIRRAVVSFKEPFAISDVMKACPDISRDMVRYVLRQMRDEGIIKSKGIGRGAKWEKKS